MIDIPSIQWFPGHMAKTRRLIAQNISLVDLIVEIRDARIPLSSKNPELDKLINNKPKIILLNKSDMADERMTKLWCNHLNTESTKALAIDCKSAKGLKQFTPAVREVLKEVLARREAKGMVGRPIRMMIVGIPNVGKSSFINKMANSKRAKVEDRPGVTKGKQWVKLDSGDELLDMPGVLWPKFEDKQVGLKLAFTGAIKDDVIDIETLCANLLELLNTDYKAELCARYNLSNTDNLSGYELLELVGRKRGMLVSGGEVNTERAAITVIDEYRSGKIGRFTLDKPE